MSNSEFNFSLSRVGLQVFMENFSFQAPSLTGFGVLGGQVGLADAGQVEARIGKGIERAFCDQGALELSKTPENSENELSGGCGRVYPWVRKVSQLCPTFFHGVDDFQQIAR